MTISYPGTLKPNNMSRAKRNAMPGSNGDKPPLSSCQRHGIGHTDTIITAAARTTPTAMTEQTEQEIERRRSRHQNSSRTCHRRFPFCLRTEVPEFEFRIPVARKANREGSSASTLFYGPPPGAAPLPTRHEDRPPPLRKKSEAELPPLGTVLSSSAILFSFFPSFLF